MAYEDEGMYTDVSGEGRQMNHPSVQWQEHLKHRAMLRAKADQTHARKLQGLGEFERSKLSPEELATQKAVINLDRDFRHRYENADAFTVSEALRAFMDATDKRDLKLQNFRSSAGYDAKNIVRLVEEGRNYNWDDNQPARHYYDEGYEGRLRNAKSDARKLIGQFRESGMSLKQIEEERRKAIKSKKKKIEPKQETEPKQITVKRNKIANDHVLPGSSDDFVKAVSGNRQINPTSMKSDAVQDTKPKNAINADDLSDVSIGSVHISFAKQQLLLDGQEHHMSERNFLVLYSILNTFPEHTPVTEVVDFVNSCLSYGSVTPKTVRSSFYGIRAQIPQLKEALFKERDKPLFAFKPENFTP